MSVRFHADPSKLRVAVRPCGFRRWYASVSTRDGTRTVARIHASPTRAVALVLRAAANYNFPGVDLDLMFAYPHPMEPPCPTSE